MLAVQAKARRAGGRIWLRLAPRASARCDRPSTAEDALGLQHSADSANLVLLGLDLFVRMARQHTNSSRPLPFIAIAIGIVFVYFVFLSPTSPSSSPLNLSKAGNGSPSAPKGKAAAAAAAAAQWAVEEDDESVDPQTSTFVKRIVAVGDIHGDLHHLTRILRAAKLIDLASRWIGGKSVLVQTGDIVDRGRDTIALYRFMDSLRGEAERAGGGVVSLLGNHELMNAMGDWRYVTPEDLATFGGERNRRAAMTTGWIGQTWRANYSITARVPFTAGWRALPPSLTSTPPPTPFGSSSQHFLGEGLPPPLGAHISVDPFADLAGSFVHGGILDEYLDTIDNEKPIAEINRIGGDILESLVTANSPLSLPRSATPEQRRFWGEKGPMWARDYALNDNDVEICAQAKRVCERLNVRHLVMGHTPNFDGIVSRCDGQVLLIDTGISRAYGGSLSALEIRLTLKPVPADGTEQREQEQDQVLAAMAPKSVPAEEIEDFDSRVDLGSASVREMIRLAGPRREGFGRWVEQERVSAIYTDERGEELIKVQRRVVDVPYK